VLVLAMKALGMEPPHLGRSARFAPSGPEAKIHGGGLSISDPAIAAAMNWLRSVIPLRVGAPAERSLLLESRTSRARTGEPWRCVARRRSSTRAPMTTLAVG
jgi:hypothetical protein